MRVIATGRSDYPNQVNNVPVLPVYLSAAHSTWAPRTINEAMKLGRRCMRIAGSRALPSSPDIVAMLRTAKSLPASARST